MFLLGLVVGLLLSLIAFGILAERRAAWLQSFRLELKELPVPSTVLADIRCAEAVYYSHLPFWRRTVERSQDALAIASPAVAYRFNWSVGSYRIKARTIEQLLVWAGSHGYLSIDGETRKARHSAISYFAEQPVLSGWEASLYLEWLRQDHPDLARKSWGEIEANDKLVAKLYSGYMGAGGDMDLWRSTIEPGPVAVERLKVSRAECRSGAD